MHIPDHLQKSRHGIWYYRWVVPKSARQTDPTLPTEIKRVDADIFLTRGADLRVTLPLAERDSVDARNSIVRRVSGLSASQPNEVQFGVGTHSC